MESASISMDLFTMKVGIFKNHDSQTPLARIATAIALATTGVGVIRASDEIARIRIELGAAVAEEIRATGAVRRAIAAGTARVRGARHVEREPVTIRAIVSAAADHRACAVKRVAIGFTGDDAICAVATGAFARVIVAISAFLEIATKFVAAAFGYSILASEIGAIDVAAATARIACEIFAGFAQMKCAAGIGAIRFA